ncbi:hypothetical protein PHYC_00039 [Phycisphaerales bacterium]|nr:hypothetical protein PHYC_00039 [Phycisphaerales bacterium]
MLVEALALAATLSAVQPINPGYLNRFQSTRNIAGCPAYPAAQADDVHRPGFNGRLWEGRVVMGGVESIERGCNEPGARSYGATDRGQIVYARVGELTIGINPWHRWNDESFPMHEAARNQWLAENGYTGGVRTFVNDAAMVEGQIASAEPRREIKPLFIIPIPEDATHFRSRMQVDAGELNRALQRLGQANRVPQVLPATRVAAK